MSDIRKKLGQSLQTGFINKVIHSNKNYCPQLVLNDKKSGLKVLTTIQKELLKCDHFWFSVAFVTGSGVMSLINTLVELDKKGIKGKLLVSQYLNFTDPAALRRLLQLKNIDLKIAVEGDFHSKGYLFQSGELYDLIIGSSNLTGSALSSNKELNLKVTATEDSDIIHQSINEFKAEFDKAKKVDHDYISDYEVVYKESKKNNKSSKRKYRDYI